jgi:hypothetical protein
MTRVIPRQAPVVYIRDEFQSMHPRDDFSTFFRENKTLIREYIDLRTDLLRLQGVRLMARSFSFLMVGVIIVLMALFILLFLGIAFAFWIAALTGSQVIGFLCSAALFLLVLVLFIAFRRMLFQNPLVRLFIRESDTAAEEENQEPWQP